MTTTYLSLLRGINVSGRKMIKMEALRQLYTEMGFNNAQTYIQSGNVVFQTVQDNCTELQQTISKKIEERFKIEVAVFVIEVDELKRIVSGNPFLKDDIDIAQLHVTFLEDTPSSEVVAKLHQMQLKTEQFQIIGKTVYLNCLHGYGKTKFSNTFFEKQLSVKATTRNWKTVLELQYMVDDINQRH